MTVVTNKKPRLAPGLSGVAWSEVLEPNAERRANRARRLVVAGNAGADEGAELRTLLPVAADDARREVRGDGRVTVGVRGALHRLGARLRIERGEVAAAGRGRGEDRGADAGDEVVLVEDVQHVALSVELDRSEVVGPANGEVGALGVRVTVRATVAEVVRAAGRLVVEGRRGRRAGERARVDRAD